MGGKTVRWGELTTNEIAELDRDLPVVLNLAAIEQHGPHLPLATDALVGKHFLEEIERLDKKGVLIAPQITVCCSTHHMDFDGTLTVRHETMLQYVCDMVDSIHMHGFRNIVLFNSHGGNEAIGQVVLEKWGAANPDASIFMLTWWRVAREELRAIQESDFGGVGHACEFETSLLMHFAPDAVRGEILAYPPPTPTFTWAQEDMLNAPCGTFYRSMKEISGGSGVAGAPQFASSKKGAQISKIVSTRLVRMLRDIKQGAVGRRSSHEAPREV